MAVDLLAVGGVLLAVAAGAWWYVRARGLVPARGKTGVDAAAAGGARQPAPPQAEDDESDAADDDFDYAPELRPQSAAVTDDDAFRRSFEWQHLHRELERLQQRCAEQDRTIAGLRADVEDLRERLAPAPAGVSPEYDAALAYARRGVEAAAIAERCGITLAEAELVRAMAQR